MAAMTSEALGRRVETGWATAVERMALAYGATRPEVGTLRIGGGTAVGYGAGSPLSPMLSQAQGFGFDGPASEPDLDRVMAFYAGRGEPHSFEVATLAHPGLLNSLAGRGYRPTETTHMLLREVISADSAPGGPADEMTVARAVGPDAAVCSDVVMRGFFEGDDAPPEGLAEVMTAMTAGEGSSRWLARIGGVPAGGAALLVHEGLAMFAGDSTLASFRRRGVQESLIQARLAEAARLGCDLAAVTTQPGSASQRNYERLGFRLSFARVLMALPR